MSAERPANPITFADTVNYPGGTADWSSQPTKVEPAVGYFTPEVPIGADEINYLVNKLAVHAQGMQDWAGQLVALNFGPEKIDSLPLTAACYDPVSKVIFYAGPSAAAPGQYRISYSSDGGANFSRSSLNATAAQDFWALHPSVDGLSLIALEGSNTTSINKFTLATYVWSRVTAAAPDITAPGESFIFNNLLIVAYPRLSGGITGVFHVYTSANGDTAWTNVATLTATTQDIGALFAATGPSIAVVVPCTGIPSSIAVPNKYITSTDGTAWTLQTFAGITLVTESFTGVCYSSTDEIFYATVVASGDTRVYSSPDAVTWSSVGTVTGAKLSGIASVGSLLAAIDYTEDMPDTQRVLISTDGGIIWGRTQMRLTDDNDSEPKDINRDRLPCKIVVCENRIMAINGMGTRVSMAVGTA